MSEVKEYRSVFLSDIHLGTRSCQAEALLDFLKSFESENLYLVGDIIDCWAMQKNIYWPQTHNDVIQKILRKGRKGTKITYLPGNHDEIIRKFGDQYLGAITIVDRTVYTDLNDRNIVVMHGDQFDIVIKNAKWLAHLGSWAYDFTISLNVFVNRIRSWFGLDYWSLSQWAKYKVKEAVNFIGDYEVNLSGYARTHNAQGIICGHIHHANIRDINSISYMNCGDWVESCTALVENLNGTWEIIKWK